MDDDLLRESPTEFFRERLRAAFAEQRIEPSEAAEAYLVRLLDHFVRTADLIFDRPLALAYLESMHDSPAARYATLKQIADTSLFVTGLFLENVEATAVGAAYYVALGGTAYRELSRLPISSLQGPVVGPFHELSVRFADFVRVLGEIDVQNGGNSRETLAIYRRWLVTRGGRDAERLVRRGLIPFAPRRTWTQ